MGGPVASIFIGSRHRVHEVLNRKREPNMIRQSHAGLGIPAESFITVG
jgi:HTH-type transcriptional regulator / antitoxin HigA